MKVTTLQNGWTVQIDDVDVARLTDEEVSTIGCLVGTNTLVVIKNQQHLTVEDELQFIKKFGLPYVDNAGVTSVVLENSERMIRRVTGEKDKDGKYTGLFPLADELFWHANPVEDPNRKPVVYLRAVSGVEGSVTSFTNHVVVYDKMDVQFREQLEKLNLQVLHEHDQSNAWAQTMIDLYGTAVRTSMYKSEADLPHLIYENEFGTRGLYFSFAQFGKFVGMSKEDSDVIANKLTHLITRTKNVRYKHEWVTGDIILSDQWLGLHKRHAFEQIETRLLHRATVDYSGIDRTLKQKALDYLN